MLRQKVLLRVPCAPTNKGETLLAYFLSVLPRQCATMLRNQRWNSSAQYGLLQGTVRGECQDTVFPVPVRKVVQIISSGLNTGMRLE